MCTYPNSTARRLPQHHVFRTFFNNASHPSPVVDDGHQLKSQPCFYNSLRLTYNVVNMPSSPIIPDCASCEEGYVQGYQYSCRRCDGEDKKIAIGCMVAVLVFALLVWALVVDRAGDGGCRDKLWTICDKIVKKIPVAAIKIVFVVWQIVTQVGHAERAKRIRLITKGENLAPKKLMLGFLFSKQYPTSMPNALCVLTASFLFVNRLYRPYRKVVKITGVEYPAVYAAFLSWLDIINLNIGFILSASCIVEMDFFDRLVFATVGPVLVLALLGGTYVIARKTNIGNDDTGNVWHKHISIAIFFLFFIYSSVSHHIFSAFSCETLDDGISYLRADYSVRCWSDRHVACKAYAGLMVLVYPVGIPVLSGVWLWYNREDLVKDDNTRNSNTKLEAFSSIWQQYKPSRFWYELIEYGRLLCLTGIAVFIFPNSAAQVGLRMRPRWEGGGWGGAES